MKPTKEELLTFKGKKVPDIIAPNLNILFCGINPGLYSAFSGHHFARPGNRFWKALYIGRFTEYIYKPEEDITLPKINIGITNLIERATVSADELTVEEFKLGAKNLEKKIKKYKPKIIAFLGVGSYKSAFDLKKVSIGMQDKTFGETKIWVLPNPSGLNAHFQVADFGELFSQLRIFSEKVK